MEHENRWEINCASVDRLRGAGQQEHPGKTLAQPKYSDATSQHAKQSEQQYSATARGADRRKNIAIARDRTGRRTALCGEREQRGDAPLPYESVQTTPEPLQSITTGIGLQGKGQP